MIDNMPLWLSVPLFIVVSVSAFYLRYIKPGHDRDITEEKK